MQQISSKPIVDIHSHSLFTPDITPEFLNSMKEGLLQNYHDAEVTYEKCPDLCQWGVIKPGIGSDHISSNVLVDAGGFFNLLDPAKQHIFFDANNIAQSVNLPNAYMIGASAVTKHTHSGNGELVPCQDCQASKRASRTAETDSDGKNVSKPYNKSYLGIIANLFLSEGKTTDVIKIVATKRKGEDSFTGAIRKALKNVPGCGGNKQIGLGGVFNVESGTIRSHVIQPFKPTKMEGFQQVNEWLKKYTHEGPITGLSCVLSDDPTGSNMHLMLDHTHFFKRDGTEAGHYEHDTTPDVVKYVGYYTMASKIYKLNDSCNSSS